MGERDVALGRDYSGASGVRRGLAAAGLRAFVSSLAFKNAALSTRGETRSLPCVPALFWFSQASPPHNYLAFFSKTYLPAINVISRTLSPLFSMGRGGEKGIFSFSIWRAAELRWEGCLSG